jgi:filamentous hemagglutinin family protein
MRVETIQPSIARSRLKPRIPDHRLPLLIGASLLTLVGMPMASANPSGGRVAAGQAKIGGTAGHLTVRQTSNRAIIDWKSFSVGSGETARFKLPSANSAVLNRVIGDHPSALLGELYSNGQVYLLNPHGIVVGPNGVIDTKSFIASTLDTANNAFMAGGPQMLKGGSTAGITVLGTVKAQGGDVLLVAARLDNKGAILAPDGHVTLAAGSKVLYVPEKDSNIMIAAPAPKTGTAVDNEGVIKAASVQLAAAGSTYALAINNGGQISATGIRRVGGHVVLEGGDGDVTNSGTVTAAAGTVALTGGRVAVTGNARVEVSGASGGRVAITASSAATVTKHAIIDAGATGNGNGGTIRIKSAKATNFAGRASVAAAGGGKGGRAEISGESLQFSGDIDRSAASGNAGTLLFDPTDIKIVSGNAARPARTADGLWAFAENAAGIQTISVAAVEGLLANGNLELQASNSLTVGAPVSGHGFPTIATAAAHNLTLRAPTIALDGSISLPNGTLTLGWSNSNVLTFGTSAGSITSSSSATVTAKRINVAGNYSSVTLNGPVTASSLHFTQPNFVTDIVIRNPANAIAALVLAPTGSNEASNFDVESSTALTVTGDIINPTAGPVKLVAGGDLTLNAGIAGADITLASTGGVLDNRAGPDAVTSFNGRIVVYSATNGVSASGTKFNDGHIGQDIGVPVVVGGVHYPDDPNGASFVEYFTRLSSVPTLTITAKSFTRTYGQPDPVFTAIYSGGTARNLTIRPSFRIVEGSDINVGIYSIEPYGASSDTRLLRYVDGTLTVNPAVLTISAPTLSMTYGHAVPTLTPSITGFVNGDTSGIVSGLTITDIVGPAPGAGSYTLIPSGAVVATPLGGIVPNYKVVYETGTLTVRRAPLTITPDFTKAYGAGLPSILPASDFSGLVNGDTPDSLFRQPTLTTSGVDAGTYRITASGAADPNYAIRYAPGTLTITPVPLTITPDLTKVYGAGLPSILPVSDFSGLVNGDTPASLSRQPTLTTSGVDAGTYLITASGAADSNYVISYAPGTLTIARAPLTISANDAARIYGSANPVFTATYDGLTNGDTSSVVTGLTFTTAGSGADAGTYQIVPSGASAANYRITYAPGSLTVRPAPLTITAADAGRTYGSANPVFRAVYDGLTNGDTSSVVTGLTFSAAASSADVGTYEIVPSGASAGNYRITYAPGTLTVTPAPLVITPTGAMLYGQSPSTPGTVTYDISGFVNGDTLASLNVQPTFLTSANSGSQVGSYFITASGASDPNYAIIYQRGLLQINPTPVTLTPQQTTITFGSTIPNIPLVATGLVNGDTIDGLFSGPPAVTTIANANAPAGSYATTISGTVTNKNYAVTLRPGTLTIEGGPSPLTGIFVSPNSTNVDPLTTAITTITLPPPPQIPTVTPPSQPDITLNPLFTAPQFFGKAIGSFGPEAGNVIDQFIATLTPSTPPVTREQVVASLKNPATAPAMEGLLLPFLFDDLKSILDQPESSWTEAQADFVGQVQKYIQSQREAAADQAAANYQAWAQQQQDTLRAKLAATAGRGVEQMSIIQNAALSPPIPPADFMQQLQAGFVMTNNQVVAMSGVVNTLSDLNKAIVGNMSVAAVSGLTSAGISLSLKGGNPADIARVIGSKAISKISNDYKLSNALADAADKLTDGGKDTVRTIEATKSVGSAVATAGVVIEVAANLAQIGMTAAAYGQAATYNTDFQNALNAAGKPVSVSALKAMAAANPQQMLTYLMLGMTGQGEVPTPAKPTVPISAILQITQTL